MYLPDTDIRFAFDIQLKEIDSRPKFCQWQIKISIAIMNVINIFNTIIYGKKQNQPYTQYNQKFVFQVPDFISDMKHLTHFETI